MLHAIDILQTKSLFQVRKVFKHVRGRSYRGIFAFDFKLLLFLLLDILVDVLQIAVLGVFKMPRQVENSKKKNNSSQQISVGFTMDQMSLAAGKESLLD